MTRTTYSFFAVLSLALVMVAVGSPPGGSPLIWTGYGLQANILAAAVAVGAHLVLAALIYRLWKGLRWGADHRLPAVMARPTVHAPRMLSHDARADFEVPDVAHPDVALIGLRGLTARAAERGDLGTARKLARRGLADSPGTGWLEELLDNPIAPPSKV
ncbi:MAG: hypothetical protein IID55_00560 [Proteobacteria bacterium]|nr:hypothetical protein [Pseudomonadota bacterium]